MKSLLDTVEPDAYEEEYGFLINTTKQFITGEFERRQFYVKETVESLLAECRKQTLLEAKSVSDYYAENSSTARSISNELRRMAEGEE